MIAKGWVSLTTENEALYRNVLRREPFILYTLNLLLLERVVDLDGSAKNVFLQAGAVEVTNFADNGEVVAELLHRDVVEFVAEMVAAFITLEVVEDELMIHAEWAGCSDGYIVIAKSACWCDEEGVSKSVELMVGSKREFERGLAVV